MTTLAAYAAFLTARWDEQEAVVAQACGTGITNRGTGIEVDWVDAGSDSGPSGVLADTDYLRADLAAKRDALRTLSHYVLLGNLSPEARQIIDDMADHLAEPFRDHPDHPANQETRD